MKKSFYLAHIRIQRKPLSSSAMLPAYTCMMELHHYLPYHQWRVHTSKLNWSSFSHLSNCQWWVWTLNPNHMREPMVRLQCKRFGVRAPSGTRIFEFLGDAQLLGQNISQAPWAFNRIDTCSIQVFNQSIIQSINLSINQSNTSNSKSFMVKTIEDVPWQTSLHCDTLWGRICAGPIFLPPLQPKTSRSSTALL
jgi:hypothetical protein